MKILSLESSCDETSAAVLSETKEGPVLLSNVVSSQIDIHKKYGGVVPEVAARAHIENIIPVIEEALKESKTTLAGIDYFAVTRGPGLIGSLVVGVETAKALAQATGKPLIPLNHLEGHIYANFLEKEKPKFPIIALLASGGHTILILMRDHLNYEVIGSTRDDAAGEAFDKGAKILELGYPGGPIISALAESGDENAYPFPTIDLTESPKRNKDGFLVKPELSMDFSFSGLKTALLNIVKGKGKLTERDKKDLSASYQKAIIDHLVQNSLRAVKKYHPKSFILSGGVAANKKLRERLGGSIKGESKNVSFKVPESILCTDNAGMMAATAYYKVKKAEGKIKSDLDFSAEPNLELN